MAVPSIRSTLHLRVPTSAGQAVRVSRYDGYVMLSTDRPGASTIILTPAEAELVAAAMSETAREARQPEPTR